MKKLQKMKKQLLSGLVMLSISIPLLLIALSVESRVPTLAFEGVQMEMQPDGSVQMLVEVSVQNVEEASPTVKLYGARFKLLFNSEYLTPSDHKTNEALGVGTNDLPYRAFRYSPKLYQVKKNGVMEPEDPFKHDDAMNRISDGELTLNLIVRSDLDVGETTQGLGSLLASESGDRCYIDQKGTVVLGTLSFRVEPENLDKLPEITENFGNKQVDKKEDPVGRNGKYLIHYADVTKIPNGLNSGDWAIEIFRQEGDFYIEDYLDNSRMANLNPSSQLGGFSHKAVSHFTFEFPKLVIGVEPVEPELTVDAYQAYTTGHIGDLDIVLQKYSPAVLVRYSDGTQENVIFPWGRTAAPWTESKVLRRQADQVDWDDTTDVIKDEDYYKNNYATEGDYKIEKLYCYADPNDPTGNTVKVFPLPVSVHLTVTPITLLDVTASDLYRVYLLNNNLVRGATSVQTLSDLDLPDRARLITDVPAGGATLTMTIPGWSHINLAKDETDGPVYWPYNRATGDGSGSGPQIVDLWKNGATTATGEYLHWPTENDQDKWNTTEGNSDSLGKNRAGDYTFVMAQGYGQEPVKGFQRVDIKAAYPWLTVPDCTKLPGDPESWPLDNALRRIVWNDSEEDEKKLVDRNLYQVTYESTITDKTIEPELFLPNLTLRVAKRAGVSSSAGYSSLPETAWFRVKLPDGTLVGTTYTLTADVNTADWFDGTKGNSGHYVQEMVSIDAMGEMDYDVYDLKLNPGVTNVGDHAAQRERLLRYINLGGWFSVSINEDPEAYHWSDYIPVYVEPRKNVHLEDKVYNFVGENAALYRFVNVGMGTSTDPMIPTTVTLPAGSYKTVDEKGNPKYDDGDEQVRQEERYGVKTLYSGVTGSQFGELNTFSIEPSLWDVDTASETDKDGNPITRYGANEFKHDAHYGAYNYVHNPGLELVWAPPEGSGDPEPKYPDRTYEATIRTQGELLAPEKPEDPDNLKEKIKLVYEGPVGGVTPHDPTIPIANRPNVELVTFDTQVEGYTLRQEYTLTIVNVGDVDINGLSIDMLTDKLYDRDEDGNLVADSKYWQEGGNFTLLKPPASFLPAGEKTTFTLSYVYDLRAAQNGNALEYLDKLFITSDKKHAVEPGAKAGEDYLLDFDAQFKVSGSKIHHVWVEYNPANGCMGTAQVIVGQLNDGTMNITAGSNAAVKDTTVYVMATPTDEYAVQACAAVYSNGTPVAPSPWTGDITLPDGTTIHIDEHSQIRIWSLTMPDYDVTVTIDFYEPISSKLRLSDLKAYASTASAYLYDDDTKMPLPLKDRKPFEYAVWQKSFTDEEYSDAAKNRPDKNVPNAPDPNRDPTEEERDRFLMQHGTVTRKGYDESVNQYLVVVPYEADYSQIEATLRKVPYTLDGANPNLPRGVDNDRLNVEMIWFPEDVDPFTFIPGPEHQIYSGDGNTATPTTHTSRAFASPTPGSSNYVRIRIHYSGTVDGAPQDVSRYYFVEIHRMPREPVAELNYGNSPYGMIMNATNIDDADRAAAKKAFVDNKYSFDGLPDNLVPKAVKEADQNAEHDKFFPVNAFTSFSKLHYWTEAWVAPDAAYEPESHMGFNQVYSNANDTWTWVPDPNIYKEGENLDLSDVSFFAIIGEAFKDPGLANVLDSTGRPGRIGDAVLSLEVYTLDTTAATQTGRFTVPDKPDGRIITLRRNIPAGSTIPDWSSLERTKDEEHPDGQYIRPGRYQLVYTLPDFDYDDYMATPEAERDPDHDPTLKVVRDFVVLAPVGDVNADMPSGKANADDFVSDNTDHLLVKGRITEPLGYMADNYPDGAIFKLRTCDVNNDRNINNIDANTIRVNKCVKRYYLPVDYKK